MAFIKYQPLQIQSFWAVSRSLFLPFRGLPDGIEGPISIHVEELVDRWTQRFKRGKLKRKPKDDFIRDALQQDFCLYSYEHCTGENIALN